MFDVVGYVRLFDDLDYFVYCIVYIIKTKTKNLAFEKVKHKNNSDLFIFFEFL